MTPNDMIQTAEDQTQEIIAVSQFEQIIDAAGIMHQHGIGCLIVAADRDDETMVGIISERDILGWISSATPNTYSQKVREVMTTNVISCQPGASVSSTLEQMKRYHMRHMPIVENGRAVGMLSVRDLLERHFNSNSDRI
jgi:signal-transduction protein with cAMP-binding, CBS, and nucleotidyltransferase domain